MNNINVIENTNLGQIQISNEVIANIAITASREVEGVIYNNKNAVKQLFKDNISNKVEVDIFDNVVAVRMDITVAFNSKIQEITQKVQSKVRNAVETMTGLEVGAIDIIVSDIQ